MPQATKRPVNRPLSSEASISQIREGFWVVARCMGQHRVHERLLRAAGVRVDRAGAALLYVLHAHGDSRVTAPAEMLGVDAPSVTRKVQQLEKEGLVARRADSDDRRASCIELTNAGTARSIASSLQDELGSSVCSRTGMSRNLTRSARCSIASRQFGKGPGERSW